MNFPHPINPILPLLREAELRNAFEGREKTSLFKPEEVFVHLFRLPSGHKININFFLQTHNQCFGITDSGKTEGMAVLSEELLLKGVKILILDSSKADFVSLKDLPGAKVKIMPVAGNPVELARQFMEGEHSWVFDKRGVRQAVFVPFFRIFFETFLNLSVEEKRMVDAENAKALRRGSRIMQFIQPIKIIMEEAPDYIPSDMSTITNAILRLELKKFILSIENFARQARAYGKTLIIISQRPTDIITDIRSQTDGWFMFKQTSQNDLDFYGNIIPAANWREKKQRLAEITKFRPGECVFVSYGNGIWARFKRRRTSHASKSVTYSNISKWQPMEA